MVFPLCRRGDGRGGTSAAGQASRSASGPQDLRRMGDVLADAFELLAECDDCHQARRLEYSRFKQLAAHRLSKWGPGRKSQAANTKRRAGSARNGKCRYAADAL